LEFEAKIDQNINGIGDYINNKIEKEDQVNIANILQYDKNNIVLIMNKRRK